jgi:hypothetical protein
MSCVLFVANGIDKRCFIHFFLLAALESYTPQELQNIYDSLVSVCGTLKRKLSEKDEPLTMARAPTDGFGLDSVSLSYLSNAAYVFVV